MSDDDIFSRWSRRKQAVAKTEDVSEPPEKPVEEIAEPTNQEEETALLEKLGLPRPECLKEGDDFSVFMKAGVPEFLRNRALRVLWRSNPILANLDGLNDYDDDFNSPELTKKVLATAYKVGRGILREPSEDAPEVAEEDSTQDENLTYENLEGDSEIKDLDEVAEGEPVPSFDEVEEEDAAFRPRRMRFRT